MRKFHLKSVTGAVLTGTALATAVVGPALAQTAAQTTPGEATGQVSPQAAPDSANRKPGIGVEEIVVSAQKRPEVARSISGSISAFSEAALEQLGAQSMTDYLTRTPGVVFDNSTPGDSIVSIRGVSTSNIVTQGQGTVGYFINDVPLTDPSYSVATPDIDTFDVDNVAVLRGPQGTLFGSSSLGGAINYEAAKPDLTKFDMHLQGTVDGVDHGDAGGSGKLMLNVPITDNFAIRGVYTYRDDAGYIDNIGTHENDTNRTLIRGGRFEALWKPGPDTTLSYLFLDQTEDTGDLGYQEPDIAGTLKKSTTIPETADFGTMINNLRLDQELSFATLTATATYHRKTQYTIADYGPILGSVLPGASPITLAQPATSSGETFEIRLASPATDRFEYLVGLYYDDTKEKISNIGAGSGITNSIEENYGPLFGAGIGALTAPNNVWLDASLPVEGKESAVYGEATYHLDSQWKATFGGRLFYETVSSETDSKGFYDLATAGVLSSDISGKQSANGFNPKGSLTWTPSDDFMSYALVSKGFRMGGPNIVASTSTTPVPAQFGSDSLLDYEVGLRSQLFDRRLQLDATAFYIDWSNIQLQLRTPEELNYTANAGSARNYGFEGSARLRVTDDLSLSTNLTYLDAELTKDFDPGGGQPIVPKGSTLPGASKWQVSSSLVYYWSGAPFDPDFVVSDRYISQAPGTLIAGTPQGGYNLVDARANIHEGNYTFTLFIDNIGDSRGITTGLTGPLQQFLVQPRTIGLTVDYRL